MRIYPDYEELVYNGRIDWSNRKEPVFVYPCTSVEMRFTGSRLKIYIKNRRAYWDNYIGMILDGKQMKYLLPAAGTIALEVEVERAQKEEHELLIFKRQDACHEFAFLGAEIGEGERLLKLPAISERRIEIYGDSVSAGEVSEAVDFVGKEDPEHNGEYSNSWYSYAWMTARRLNARIQDIAQGGIALMDGTGWFHAPDYIGMETAWDKIHYNPDFGKMTEWDFTGYIPQVVIVAIGQNDSNPEDYMKEDYDGEKAVKWRERYKGFLKKLRAKYPRAQIVCCTTLLCHDRAWDGAVGQVVKELRDDKITQYLFRRNGAGTPGHLRIPEAEEMAAYIKGLDIEGWDL